MWLAAHPVAAEGESGAAAFGRGGAGRGSCGCQQRRAPYQGMHSRLLLHFRQYAYRASKVSLFSELLAALISIQPSIPYLYCPKLLQRLYGYENLHDQQGSTRTRIDTSTRKEHIFVVPQILQRIQRTSSRTVLLGLQAQHDIEQRARQSAAAEDSHAASVRAAKQAQRERGAAQLQRSRSEAAPSVHSDHSLPSPRVPTPGRKERRNWSPGKRDVRASFCVTRSMRSDCSSIHFSPHVLELFKGTTSQRWVS